MNTVYTIEIKNIDAVMMMFKTAPLKMTEEIHRAIQRSILVVQRNAMREAPVNKKKGGGNLRQSIRSEMLGIASGKIEAGASYASAVETGTRPHDIRIRNKKVLADKREGLFFGKLVKHPGTKANPFMARALEKSQKDIDNLFVKAVQNVLK